MPARPSSVPLLRAGLPIWVLCPTIGEMFLETTVRHTLRERANSPVRLVAATLLRLRYRQAAWRAGLEITPNNDGPKSQKH